MKSLVLIIVALGMTSPAFAKNRRHPHLMAAHRKVEHAIKALEAAHNGQAQFGGHRAQAEDLLKQALDQIQQAAQYANQNPGNKK